ncbi:MAG: hypothetical protein ACXW4A_05860 [Nitrospira sp.]
MKLATIKERMHRALKQLGANCSMAEAATLCPELTWYHVFLAIDALNRAGQVRVTRDEDGTDRVQALTPSRSRLPRYRQLLCKHSVNIRPGLGNP